MAVHLKSDFGNNLLGAICLNPKTNQLNIGTNKYYSEYCQDTLGLNSISYVSNKPPFFESYLTNDSITFSSASFQDIAMTISVVQNTALTYLQSANKIIYLEAGQYGSTLSLQDLEKNSYIELDTNDIAKATNISMKNMGDFYLLASASAGYAKDLTNFNSNYSDASEFSNFSFFANSSAYASYTDMSSLPVASSASYAAYSNETVLNNYSSFSLKANSGEMVNKASFIAYAITGISAPYATFVQAGKINAVDFASYGLFAEGSNSTSYASIASISNFADYSTNASYASKTTDDRLYSYATSANYSNYAKSANSASYAIKSDKSSESFNVSNIGFIQSATSGLNASYALFVENTNGSYAITSSYASYNIISKNASYALNATGFLTASYSNFASYALSSYSSVNASYALGTITASYAKESINASYSKKASYATLAFDASYAAYSSFFYGNPYPFLATYAARSNSASYSTYAPRADFAVYATRSSYNDYSDISNTDGGFTSSLGPAYTIQWQYFDMATFHTTYKAGYYQYYLYR